MSRATYATKEQIRANFEQACADALESGLWPASDQGFSNATDLALRRVAQAYPNADVPLVESAQAALTAQIETRSQTD